MNPLYSMIAAGLVRHLISAIFVALAAHGYYSQGTSTEIIAGLTGAIVMAGWSVYQKIASSQQLKDVIATIEARFLAREKLTPVAKPLGK